MVSGPIVRPIRPDDYGRVGELTVAAYDASGRRIEGPYRQWLGDPAARVDDCTALLVATIDDVVCGTVTYVRPGDPEWEHPLDAGDCGFRVLATDPEAQGRGVGAALIDECIRRSVEAGCHRMVITSMEWMTRAHGMYERRGFVRRPDLDVRYPSGVGLKFALDLSEEAADRFTPPGPVPEVPPWYEE